ncbi:MAG: threonine synthase [Caldicoprobacterales bacterium]|jgi:threonine synthase
MNYHSTRNQNLNYRSKDVIIQGLSSEGGLYVPEEIPLVSMSDLQEMIFLNYKERAKRILALYLTDYTEEELDKCVEQAYSDRKFTSNDIAPVTQLDEGLYVLELWHGPTCAFKDMALQILPHLLTTAVDSADEKKEVLILTATSGDTGKAALEGFRDVPGTRILVFYPDKGVSLMQELQMVTQEGSNVMVASVNGNFDDAQTGVKMIFQDKELEEKMREKGFSFSSANSINWGRLVPQIVYYFSAYLDLVKEGRIALGDTFNVVVPTGNFGNILAAWYGRCMGLPIHRLICASNDNKVLTDFIRTGVYDKRRKFYQTISPSMDILVSSNLERLLYEISGRSDAQVRKWMNELYEQGYYKVEGIGLKEIQSVLWGGYATEEETLTAIRETFLKTGYTMDTHTAVGKWVYDRYREETGDNKTAVLASTASPFKFPEDVLKAIQGDDFEGYEIELLNKLAEKSGMEIPKPLRNLKHNTIRHTANCEVSQMKNLVMSFIGL